MNRVTIFFSIILLYSNLVFSATIPCYDCSNCSAEIAAATSGDIIELQNNIIADIDYCIDLTPTKNITFDGNYYTLDGQNAYFNAIHLYKGSDEITNNTIQNVKIKSFLDYSIKFMRVHNNKVINVSSDAIIGFDGSNPNGVSIDRSNHNFISNLTATNHEDEGIILYRAHNNTIINSHFDYNREGLDLHFSQNNTLINITSINNSAIDFLYWNLESKNDCKNLIINLTCSENLPCKIVTNQSELDALVPNSYSDLIICGLSNTKIENISLVGQDVLYNNHIGIYWGTNLTINNVTSMYNHIGLDTMYINNSEYTNLKFDNNGYHGIYWGNEISNSSIINASASNNANYGFMVGEAINTYMDNITANNNTYYGLRSSGGNYNNIINNSNFHNNGNAGIAFWDYYGDSGNFTITNTQTKYNRYYGIYFSQSTIADNNIITKSIVSENGVYGIFLGNTKNNIINDSLIQENNYSDMYIYATDSMYCDNSINITGSNNYPIISYNDSIAIYNKTFSSLILCNADNSILNNITINASNTFDNNELFIGYSQNVTANDINSQGNRYGVLAWYSHNVSITSSIFNANNFQGIYLRNSNFTQVQNNTLNYNKDRGLRIYQDSCHSIITNNIIQNNINAGVSFGEYSNEYPINNTLYNNYFKNTLNAEFVYTSPVPTNFWNTTYSASTNIIGQNAFGGNFWETPSGNGFSQTCIDIDKNYICDNPYVLNGTNIDYLALTENIYKDVYYSIGTNASNLMIGAPNLTIVSGLGIFDIPQAGKVGVGDKVDYVGGAGYIASRVNASAYYLVDNLGNNVLDVSEVSVNNITRAFNSLSLAEDGADDLMGSSDLVALNVSLHLACYGDGIDSTTVVVDGWTTGVDNYIKIYTPALSSEVGVSQRHNGVWGNGYKLVSSSEGDSPIWLSELHTKIVGLQIENGYTGSSTNRAGVLIGLNIDYIEITNNLIKGNNGIAEHGISTVDTQGTVIANNIVYDCGGVGIRVRIDTASGADNHVYQNTVYNCANGLSGADASYKEGPYVINNVVFNNDDDFIGWYKEINYTASDDGDGSNAINMTALGLSWDDQFVDYTGYDFRLKDESVLIDSGTTIADFDDDILGNFRPQGVSWDIGAFEGAAIDEIITYISPTPQNNAKLEVNNLIVIINDTTNSISWAVVNINSVLYPLIDNGDDTWQYTYVNMPTTIETVSFQVSTNTLTLENRTVTYYPDYSSSDVPFGGIGIYIIALSLILLGGFRK